MASTRPTGHPDGPAVANLRRVLWHLLGGTRGGPLRIRILDEIRQRPYNTNQLAELLGVDYKTVQHHLRVLVENRVLSSTGQDYGAVFLPTPDMEASWPEFESLVARVKAKRERDEARKAERATHE